jgi:hypothetical protein
VLIELDGEHVDLALQLGEAVRQAIALLPERLGQRHHGFDEPFLAGVGQRDVGHRRPPATVAAQAASRMPTSAAWGRALGARAVSPT